MVYPNDQIPPTKQIIGAKKVFIFEKKRTKKSDFLFFFCLLLLDIRVESISKSESKQDTNYEKWIFS